MGHLLVVLRKREWREESLNLFFYFIFLLHSNFVRAAKIGGLVGFSANNVNARSSIVVTNKCLNLEVDDKKLLSQMFLAHVTAPRPH